MREREGNMRISITLTADELDEIDRRRGGDGQPVMTRSEYLRRCALALTRGELAIMEAHDSTPTIGPTDMHAERDEDDSVFSDAFRAALDDTEGP